MFLARFPFRASPLDGICAALPHGSPTLRWGLYHVPVAGVGVALSGAASPSPGETGTDYAHGTKSDISDGSSVNSHRAAHRGRRAFVKPYPRPE